MHIPIKYVPNFLDNPLDVADVLWNELSWLRHDKVPRSEYYCNELNVVYKYGIEKYARTYLPQSWHPQILAIKKQVSAQQKSDVLEPMIEIFYKHGFVSLGVEREIWFKENNSEEVYKHLLQNGSLCLMCSGMQDTHKHRIPKASFTCGKRISLTFRGYKDV